MVDIKSLKHAVQSDGGLFDLGRYLEWLHGEEKATLDGDFNGNLEITFSELDPIVAALQPRPVGLLNVYVTPVMPPDVAGFAALPGNIIANNWAADIFVNYNYSTNGTLAHEIGHALTNQVHGAFDAVLAAENGGDKPYFYPYGYSGRSDYVNNDRRVTRSVIQTIHKTPTNEDPSGNFILQPYTSIPHPIAIPP